MSLKTLRTFNQLPQAKYRIELDSRALAVWADKPFAAADGDDATVTIYDMIGEDPWTGEGFTAKRMSAALRAIGKRDVVVKINSPGGYVDEGISIYNMLAEHPAKVTVKVMGIAASSASIIAMAGDEILMGRGAMMMIHNSWGLAIGNRHDFAEASRVFEVFDRALADIYVGSTGKDIQDIMSLMDGENPASDGTWMDAEKAIDLGFSTGHFNVDDDAQARSFVPDHILARRKAEAALATAGMNRKERFDLLNKISSGQRDAAGSAVRDAGGLTSEDISSAINALKGKKQ